ncbi:Protein FIZZY-RELATED 2 (Cell cycle switch protein CCS52A1) [Durusdinium trenchii]|uniref:Protein FIZZY-RELATED 2 (Cell cycle switch protein CCS52A1) n=1 Tax=Durusdinium trenchii TaxID=1381693 RepID=A0ABP0LFK7_9DINO
MDEAAYDYAPGEDVWQEKSPAKPPEEQLDRFIPRCDPDLENRFALLERSEPQVADAENNSAYAQLLRSELLGIREEKPEKAFKTPEKSLFRYKSSPQANQEDAFSLSPVSFQSAQLNEPRKTPRKIAKVPFKVLDAPQLQDDFYLNLVDWSPSNVLSVGLSNCVYLWSAATSRVTKLCDLGADDAVTSVSWTQRGAHLAVGTNKGEVQIWDSSQCRKLRTMSGHLGRVGTMAWNGYVLSTGSRDHHILHRDVRQPAPFMSKLHGHRQEVCGLKWSFDEQQLASGGNDNKLCVWSLKSNEPVLKFNQHQAAVKAIAWSPHQHGLLASGGGTADRCIRFWNTVNNMPLSSIDTGSQVCNLVWSKNLNEIVSTHGYSLNQIILWKYPAMTKVATLTGHTYRVLYLAISPDGQTVVTGAGDETLRFWNVFPSAKSRSGSGLSSSLPLGRTIR